MVALLPTLALAALTILQLLVAGATAEYAGHAAEAGAVAILQDHDPAAAARASLPAWTGRHVDVRVRGRTASRVRLRPRRLLPFVADALAEHRRGTRWGRAVTELLARVRALFVAPASTPAAARPAAAAAVPSVALLCRPADALATGGALALALARDARARRALVASGGPGRRRRTRCARPPCAEARRLVHALAAHGLEAEASGRLARTVLPDEPEAALAAGARAAAVAAAPTVLALAGPRDAVLDRLIAAQDLVVVAQAPGADAASSPRSRSRASPRSACPALACTPVGRRAVAMLAAAGVAAPRAAAARARPGGRGGRDDARGGQRETGQALLLLVGALAAVLVGAFVLGAVARGVGAEGRDQRAADLGALAGARAMRAAYDRLFEPPDDRGPPQPRPPRARRLPRAGARRGHARRPGQRCPERWRSPSRTRARSRRCAWR